MNIMLNENNMRCLQYKRILWVLISFFFLFLLFHLLYYIQYNYSNFLMAEYFLLKNIHVFKILGIKQWKFQYSSYTILYYSYFTQTNDGINVFFWKLLFILFWQKRYIITVLCPRGIRQLYLMINIDNRHTSTFLMISMSTMKI